MKKWIFSTIRKKEICTDLVKGNDHSVVQTLVLFVVVHFIFNGQLQGIRER